MSERQTSPDAAMAEVEAAVAAGERPMQVWKRLSASYPDLTLERVLGRWLRHVHRARRAAEDEARWRSHTRADHRPGSSHE